MVTQECVVVRALAIVPLYSSNPQDRFRRFHIDERRGEERRGEGRWEGNGGGTVGGLKDGRATKGKR